MKIYTKTGDTGKTSLFGGTRVPKHNNRIDSYGTVDELNAHMGMVRDQKISNEEKTFITGIQENLFTIGAILATEPEKQKKKDGSDRLDIAQISEGHIEQLEKNIDEMNEGLPEMTHFILPGGHVAVSHCHIARTVCRRAERRVTELHQESPVDPLVIKYLNRLSDWLFVLSRKLTRDLDAEEINWIPER